MSVILDRVDSAPIRDNEFPFEFNQWLAVLVDTLNEVINALQDALDSTGVVAGTTQLALVNSRYIIGNAAQTTITLPDIAAVGSRVTIEGFGAGGWVLVPGTGQTIKVASVGGSAATSITSASRYDSISITCVEENTTWSTLSAQTTGFVIV